MDNISLKKTKHSIYKIKKKINHWKNFLIDPQPKLLILVYHRILPEVKFNPLNSMVSLKTFVKQIEILERKYPIVPLSEIAKQCENGNARSKTQAALTFDDGYQDNYEIVLPILKHKGLPATFFLATDYIGSNKPLWDWELIAKEYRANDRCMTWEEAIKIAQSGMEIGAHGLSHRSLSLMTLGEAIGEIKGSKEIIEKNVNKPCFHFAFPFGSKKDYNQILIDSVKNAEFKTCLLNVHGYNHIEKEKFCFKRIIMEESADLNYLLG